MSTTIRLDASALSALIEADPDFKLELQRAVVAEVIKKVYLKDFKVVVEALAPQIVKDLIKESKADADVRREIEDRLKATVQSIRAGTYSYQTTRTLPAETKQLIAEQVTDLIKAEIGERVGTVESLSQRLMETLTARLEDTAERWVGSQVDGQIKARIEAGVRDRIAAITSGLTA